MKRINDHQFKKALFASILTLTLIVAGSALAQGPGMGQGKRMAKGNQECVQGDSGSRGEMRLERMAARLELTEEQTDAITKIHEAGRSKNMGLRKEMMRLRNELQGEMLKDDPSQKKVLDLNEKLGALRTEKHATRLENRLAVREQLTPEQRDKMLTMGEFKKGRNGGRGGFQKGHRGSGCGTECRIDRRTDCPKTNR
jgi:periplasmic protein CpxP/Spy